MKTYRKKVPPLAFALPSTKMLLLAAGILLLYPIPILIGYVPLNPFTESELNKAKAVVLTIGISLVLLSFIVRALTPNTFQIICMVRQGLFNPARGNPLKLQEGEILPKLRCKKMAYGYTLSISAQQSVSSETIKAAGAIISSALNRRFWRYAVVNVEEDVTCNQIEFQVEDVALDRGLTFKSITEMRPESPAKILIQQGTQIDLTTSGSILVAGKTRSGKTTGIVSMLLQVLQLGMDCYGSEVIIIDPKKAELSRLPYTISLDGDDEARAILAALKNYATTVSQRQQILNDMSEETGDAVKWWEAGFHPSFLFIDEYVALRAIFPPKVSKGSEDYCLNTFDALLKKIITMGASAGCFVIISTAEASVVEGGLPSMLRSAMTTNVLFRPTPAEGALIWNRDKINALPEREYKPGYAWFSSTDGEHERLSVVHFPRMKFPVYRELGKLLRAYYADRDPFATPPSEA